MLEWALAYGNDFGGRLVAVDGRCAHVLGVRHTIELLLRSDEPGIEGVRVRGLTMDVW